MTKHARLESDLGSPSDEELREAAERGDAEAIERLVDRITSDLSAIVEGSSGESLAVRHALAQLRLVVLEKSRERHILAEASTQQPGSRSLDDETSWREFLGPLLSPVQMMARLHLQSTDELRFLVKDARILELPTRDGGAAYPEFQIGPNGEVYPEIAFVNETFGDVIATPYTIASWLRGPKDYLEGLSPIQWLELGRDPQPVLDGAEFAAALLDL
jgi:hypothetical protein